MSYRVAETVLNASTIDILNVIRANASYEYQSSVPVVTTAHDIPKVGEALYGHPALANIFLNALINRIALVNIKSAVFNNAYAELKKGYLEFGETVEEVFVNIAKCRTFSAEKAEGRELKRSLPDVRSAFHTINWRVQYPVTIQNEDLRMAFTSIGGVQDLIAKIVDSVYTAAEYDEYLLFKYLMIKAISHGKMYPIAFDASDPKNAAKAFRGASNKITFMSKDYNAAGVQTTTPKADQFIFMDAEYNAAYDVDVLASAFNMDKADFMGKLKLIDDWTTFDNERFAAIRGESDMIEEVTDAELTLMADVKAVLLDREWFQMYDNENQFTEKFVASGLYWNYFYNVWKTVSSSPFSNAIVFVANTATTSLPDQVTVKVVAKDASDAATVLTVEPQFSSASLSPSNCQFIQTQSAVNAGVAVNKYGSIIYPYGASGVTLAFVLNGVTYTAGSTLATTAVVGDTITFDSENYVPPTLSQLKIGTVTLSPTFASGTTTYTGSTTTASQKIEWTTTNENATVAAKVVNASSGPSGTAVTNGQTLSLAASTNTFTFVVSGVVGGQTSTKTYTATITKS